VTRSGCGVIGSTVTPTLTAGADEVNCSIEAARGRHPTISGSAAPRD
jgi:hypothetical protein